MQDVPLRCRLLAWALAFVSTAALSLFLSGPPAVVHAEDNCGKVVPMDAILGDGAIAKTGATGALTTVSTTGTGGAVVSGGGAAVVGAGGNVLMGLAILLGTVDTTCKFLDWTGWNGCDFTVTDWCGEKPQPLQTQANTSMSTSQPCADLFVSNPFGAEPHCRIISFEANRPGYMTWANTRFDSWCYSTVCIPQQAFSPQYVGGTSTNYGTSTSNWRWLCSNGTTWNVSKTQTCTASSIGAQLVLSYPCVGNIGGMCGAHPSEIVLEAEQNRSGNPTTILNVWRDERPFGWSRQLMTDVRCGVGLGWVRVVTPVFYDKLVDQRVEVPPCPPGAPTTAFRTVQVPTGVTLPAPGTMTGLNVNWTVQEWFAPTSWTTGTPPEYLNCFTGGVDCGVPSLDSSTGICTWGGATVPVSFCDPARQTKTDPTLQNAPKPTGQLATPAVFDPTRATTTYTPPTTTPTTLPGGTGTGSGTDLLEVIDVSGSDVACLPGGWGKFNPISWVLQPIKCAAVWAFVPDAAALDLRLVEFEALQAEPPIQWVTAGVAYVNGVSFGFDTWANAGPECLTFVDQQVCPRTWDQQSQAPGWVVALMALGLWLVVIVGVWRFF